jgi:hypothetical protein
MIKWSFEDELLISQEVQVLFELPCPAVTRNVELRALELSKRLVPQTLE